MKKLNQKIINIHSVGNLGKTLRNKNKKIVLCHGVFDLLHIGHLKHFTSAKKYGDKLIVSITPDIYVSKGPGRPIFNQNLRAEFLSNISMIDFVVINDKATSTDLIKELKPNIYCKGSDYKNHKDDLTGQIKNELNALKKIGGQIKYTNELTNSSSKIINNYFEQFSKNQKKNISSIKKNKVSVDKIFKSFTKLKILVIGETIIDHYFFCETLGKSGKDPVLQMQEHNNEIYLGGSAAIAGHISKFCKNITLLTMLGENKKYHSFLKNKISTKINLKIIYKNDSPTIVKKKFIDSITKHKVFGSYTINDSPLIKKDEKKLENIIKNLVPKFDLVLVSDYGHGFLSRKNARLICNKSKFLALNAQINAANRGYHTMKNYKGVDCVIVNEMELRHELRDKSGYLNILMKKLSKDININELIVTMGQEGARLYNKKNNKFYNMEAFATKVVDKIGSGDTMLALLALCLKSKLNKYLSLLIASLAASQAVGNIGNKFLVDEIKLKKSIEHILK